MRKIIMAAALLAASVCFGQAFSSQVTKKYCDANMNRAVTNAAAITRQLVPPLVSEITPPIVTNIMYNGDFATKQYVQENATETVTVGNVTTGNVASIVNTGTPRHVVLDFTLPHGPKGDKGDRGDPGPVSVAVGTTTTGSPGTNASVYNSGTQSDLVLDFTIPRGNTGAQGLKGDKGDRGDPGPTTITVGTTTTGAEGSSASVVNSGTSQDLILDFSIPRGNTGSPGPVGDPGVKGESSFAASVTRDNFTASQWNTYGTVGHTENWSNTESIRGNCRTGDVFTVVGTATDTKDGYILWYRCTTASGNLAGICLSKSVITRGQSGVDGDSAGFGTPTATATTLSAGSQATVSVTSSGTDKAKVFNFEFGIPKGADGSGSTVDWSKIFRIGDFISSHDIGSFNTNSETEYVDGYSAVQVARVDDKIPASGVYKIMIYKITYTSSLKMIKDGYALLKYSEDETLDIPVNYHISDVKLQFVGYNQGHVQNQFDYEFTPGPPIYITKGVYCALWIFIKGKTTSGTVCTYYAIALRCT